MWDVDNMADKIIDIIINVGNSDIGNEPSGNDEG